MFFSRKPAEPLARFHITRDGHGDYRVSAGPGYAHGIDDMAWMKVNRAFRGKVFDSQQAAEKAIQDFEHKLVLDVRQIVAKVY